MSKQPDAAESARYNQNWAWQDSIEHPAPAEACTDVGYDDAVPEGSAIALFFLLSLFVVLLIVWAVAVALP